MANPDSSEKLALVLGGGSIKGAYQAGALEVLLSEKRVIPQVICGISVGSLNGAFIAEQCGQMIDAGRPIDWPTVGRSLTNFWTTEITDFSRIGKKRGIPKLAWAVFRKKFNGFVETEKLESLIRAIMQESNIIKCRGTLDLFVGIVDVISGMIEYARNDGNSSEYLNRVIASSAIPLVMPLKRIESQYFYDGGIRDVAPLKNAVDYGATRVIVVACQTEKTAPVHSEFNCGDVMPLANRVMEIVTNELVNNDIDRFKLINDLLSQGTEVRSRRTGHPYRQIKLEVIRPATDLGADMEKFDSRKIEEMIRRGRDDARAAIQ